MKIIEDTKICVRCKEEKQITEFSKDKTSANGIRTICKICRASQSREHYKCNKESYKNNHRMYKELHKDEIKKYLRNYFLGRKVKHKNKKAGKASVKRKRRILIQQGYVSTKDLRNLAGVNTTCFYCNCAVYKGNRYIDHYIPLSRGGLHTITNLRVACIKCNLRKSNKMPEDFIVDNVTNI